MDAVKFIQERNRMCATYTPKNCEGCPADNYGGDGIACIMIDKIDADRFVPIVEKWSATHPRKTWQSEFLRQWPDANVMGGYLQICPRDVFSSGRFGCGQKTCSLCKQDFWGQEVE